MKKLAEFEKYVILTILSLAKNPSYGIQIQEELSFKMEKKISVSAVYTTLVRLKRKGFVDSIKGKPTAERGGKSKEFFTITDAGREALDHSLETHRRFLESM